MEKFEVMMRQERVAYFLIEANSAEEAEKLFGAKLRNDDYFVDEVYECLENGIVDEEISATGPIKYDGEVDYTYEQMKERDE